MNPLDDFLDSVAAQAVASAPTIDDMSFGLVSVDPNELDAISDFVASSNRSPMDLTDDEFMELARGLSVHEGKVVIDDYDTVNRVLHTNYVRPTSIALNPGREEIGFTVDPFAVDQGEMRVDANPNTAKSEVAQQIEAEAADNVAQAVADNDIQTVNKNVLGNIAKDVTDELFSNRVASAGVGGGSLLLSNLQGRGVAGSGGNLLGALLGSVIGRRFAGDVVGNTVATGLGGLIGHTVSNAGTKLFVSTPQEDRLLMQAYGQQPMPQPIAMSGY